MFKFNHKFLLFRVNILTEQAAFLYNYLRTVAKDPINLKFDFAILKQWETLHKGNRFTKGHY